METDGSIFRAHAKKKKWKAQVSIERKKKRYIWRDNELNTNVASKKKIKKKAKTKTKKKKKKKKNKKQTIQLKGLKITCMKFCIRLLEYKSKMQKYKLPLIYAMAVLGVNKKGWWTLKNYSLIMSKVIKVV